MNRNLPFEKLPEKIIPAYKVWHVKQCRISITCLAQLADKSPDKEVQDLALYKLFLVMMFNLSDN